VEGDDYLAWSARWTWVLRSNSLSPQTSGGPTDTATDPFWSQEPQLAISLSPFGSGSIWASRISPPCSQLVSTG